MVRSASVLVPLVGFWRFGFSCSQRLKKKYLILQSFDHERSRWGLCCMRVVCTCFRYLCFYLYSRLKRIIKQNKKKSLIAPFDLVLIRISYIFNQWFLWNKTIGINESRTMTESYCCLCCTIGCPQNLDDIITWLQPFVKKKLFDKKNKCQPHFPKISLDINYIHFLNLERTK